MRAYLVGLYNDIFPHLPYLKVFKRVAHWLKFTAAGISINLHQSRTVFTLPSPILPGSVAYLGHVLGLPLNGMPTTEEGLQ